MKILLGKEANEFLERYNINVAYYESAKSLEEANKKLDNFSFPLIVKLISQDAIHKTELGCVRIVKNKEEFGGHFEYLMEAAKKNKLRVDNILLQEFIEGLELIIGLKKDPTFGYVVMLGIGGVYAESLKDITFRACPINDRDASAMLEELRARDLIFNERKQFDIEKIKKFLVRLSKLPQKSRGLVELDINPLILNEGEMRVVDARIIFE